MRGTPASWVFAYEGTVPRGCTAARRAWALRSSAREARLVAAPHVPAALSLLGIVRPGDRLVAFADDFADAFAHGFEGCDVVLVDPPSVAAFTAASEDFDASFDAEGPHLWWFVNSIGGFGLRVPDLRALGRAAREAHALLVVDNTVASALAAIRCGWVLCCPSKRSIACVQVGLRASSLPLRWRALSSSAIVWMPRLSARMPCLRAVAWPSLICLLTRPLCWSAGWTRSIPACRRISIAPVRWPSIWPPTRWCATCAIPD